MAPALQLLAAIIASALLPAATCAHLNDTVFAVTVSSQLTGGAQETLCALIAGPTEPVSLTVSLQGDSGTTIVLQEAVTQDFYHCTSFQVPAVRTRTVASVHITVQGESDSLSKKTKVLIKPPAFIHIVQTDKPVYKPGQTVMFRIVSMDTNFIPVDRVYKLVELQDPNTNRIAQWLDQSIRGGILDLSHPIIPEAVQGTYVITATTDRAEKITHSFDIKEYVLPKFEVTVQLPSVISILDQEATFKICGKYTYGKPVLGSVKAVFCRKAFRFFWQSIDKAEDLCKTFSLETDRSGCVSQTVCLKEFALRKHMYEDSFEVSAQMEEFGTGVVLEGSGSTSFSSTIRTVTFESVPEAYKPGIQFEGKVKMVGPDNQPVSNEAVYLFATDSQNQKAHQRLTTDSRGVASFSLDTTFWTGMISLRASSREKEDDEPYEHSVRKPTFQSAYHHAAAFYSKSSSFVKLMQASEEISCCGDAPVRAQYIIKGEELKKGQSVLDFFYVVMSRGVIVQHGRVPVAVKEGTVNRGELSLSLRRTTDLAPFAQVVVFTLMPSGEAVADSLDFPIELCLNNEVSLRFSSLQQLPAGKTTLRLQAQPGSVCSVRAIDQSVLLLQPEKELSIASLYSQLPVQKLTGYSYEVDDFDPYPCFPLPIPEPELEPAAELEQEVGPEDSAGSSSAADGDSAADGGAKKGGLIDGGSKADDGSTGSPRVDGGLRVAGGATAGRVRRSSFFEPPSQKNDVYSVFREVGIKLLTNSDVKKPLDCLTRNEEIFEVEDAVDSPFPMAARLMPDALQKGSEGEKKETLRTFFPETWIWDLVSVGEGGSVSLEKTLPDSITKWAAGAFCISSVGVGLSPSVGLTAFQPFFVSLTLPYSVIRGEAFTLKATVFNYLSRGILVEVSLAESEQYASRPCDGCQYSVCLCGGGSRTFSWILTPAALGQLSLKVSAEALKTDQLCCNEVAAVPDVGRIDTVVRTLLVEAEGTPQMVSHNALLCPMDGPVEKEVSLLMPEMFVAGSARASVSVLGDLMGRAMKNLDKLLAMPYGCGEQNMLLFAPNIFILNYLKATGQLTQEIQNRATRFLESGYQRQLNYKHDDGSYSAFGKSDDSGNTWLTSFVMKSFGGARTYIFVDPTHIKDARSWLSRLQRPDGCIRSVGKLFHNGMKGGVSDDVSLTAYITAALLELNTSISDPMVQSCLTCLRTALAGQLDNLYTRALLSYSFTLAGDEEARSRLLSDLHQRSSSQGGTRHWQRAGASGKGVDSLEVEMTSYVLLALLSGPPIPGFGLDYASGIVRWLTQQQNPYGGFSSTQDTVVALQALTKYAAATYSEEGTTTVTVTSLGGLNKTFIVDQSNRLLYQEERLSEVPGEYRIRAEGRSCVLAQISMHFNVPPPPDISAFNISTTTMAKCQTSRSELILFVFVSYQGRREETNMVIVNIKLLSGYILEKSSLKLLEEDRSVKRVEVEEGYINIYVDGLKKDKPQIYSVTMEEDQPVRNLKPAVVKVYDYYQTSDEAVTDYTSPCAESDDVNQLLKG